jgi:hypothetical protein
MITKSQIHERLHDYLIHAITLNEFEDWLVVQSWNMHMDSDESARQLVGAIELRLAEYSDDHLNDSALDRELAGLIAPSITVSFDNATRTRPLVTRTAFSGSSRQFFVRAVQAA